MLPSNATASRGRTAAMKLDNRRIYHRLKSRSWCRHKLESRLRIGETSARNISMGAETMDERLKRLSVSCMWPACHCFQCAPVSHGDQKWSILFESPELNASTRIAWFLPQHLRSLFIATAKGTFASYKMGLPQLSRICTMLTLDGVHFQHMYRAAWDMRSHIQSFNTADDHLSPCTIFGTIAEFLDFNEISIVSITHTFMRCYIKSEMNQLRYLKVRDFSDMSYMFWLMENFVSDYNRCHSLAMTYTGVDMLGQCKYSDKTLTFLAGMDRVYKFDVENKYETFRQSHEGRYGSILQKMLTCGFRRGSSVPPSSS